MVGPFCRPHAQLLGASESYQLYSRACSSRLPRFETRAGDARGEARASLRVLPAETMVDGLPRARSLFAMSFGVYKVRAGTQKITIIHEK